MEKNISIEPLHLLDEETYFLVSKLANITKNSSIVEILTNPLTPCYVKSNDSQLIGVNNGIGLQECLFRSFISRNIYGNEDNYHITHKIQNLNNEYLLKNHVDCVPMNTAKINHQPLFSTIQYKGSFEDLLNEFISAKYIITNKEKIHPSNNCKQQLSYFEKIEQQIINSL